MKAKTGPQKQSWLLGFHIIFSSACLGAAFVLLLLVVTPMLTSDKTVSVVIPQMMRDIDLFIIIPACLGVLLTGYSLCLLTSWGILKYRWVVVKQIGTLDKTQTSHNRRLRTRVPNALRTTEDRMSYIECLVLGLLSQGIRYGHEIDKALERSKIRLWTKATRVTVYQALNRVTTKGWVTAGTERNGKMPERTVYSLTDDGREALRQMISEGLASPELFKFDYCIPVMLLSFLPKAEVIVQMQRRRDMLRGDILLKLPPEDIDNDPSIHLGQRANLRFLRSHCRMEIEWLEWMIEQLESGTVAGAV